MHKRLPCVSMLILAACLLFTGAQCDFSTDAKPDLKELRQRFVDAGYGYGYRCMMQAGGRFVSQIEPLLFDFLMENNDPRKAYEHMWDQALASPHVQVDSAALERCIAALNTLSCGYNGDAANDCNDIFVGSLQAGQSCALGEECAGDAYCENLTNESCGSCVAYAQLDENCANAVCLHNLYCDVATQTCVRLAALNQSCSDVGCTSGLMCAEDHVCRRVPQSSFFTAGDECSNNDGIRCGTWSNTGLVCKDDDGDGNGLCVEVSIAEEGEPCEYATNGDMLTACHYGLVTTHYCDADRANGERTGTCRRRPSTAEACIEVFGYCSGLESACVNGMCEAVLPLGASCQTDSPPACELFAGCSIETHQCARQVQPEAAQPPVCD